MTFDPTECQAHTTISEDKLTLTHTGPDGRCSSVLGTRGMLTGHHVWKVEVTKAKFMYVFLGVAERAGLTAKRKNYSSTYSWCGHYCRKWILGQQSKSMERWQKKDVLQLHLDCTKHTLSIANIRSGETDLITNLPPTELFAYFATVSNEDSLSLVPWTSPDRHYVRSKSSARYYREIYQQTSPFPGHVPSQFSTAYLPTKDTLASTAITLSWALRMILSDSKNFCGHSIKI